MLDFIQFINDNVNLSAAKKVELLEDFCKQYGYEEEIDDGAGGMIPNPVTRKVFANDKISSFIKQTVNAVRRKEQLELVEYEKLILEAVP